MKRQVAKGLTMLMLVVGLTLATAAIANGQSGRQLTAQVPFDFIVAERTLRSGQYEVSNANDAGDVLAIRDADGKRQTMRLGALVIRNDQQEMSAKLVFHRYGSTYFLSQVWLAGNITGREFAMTSQERSIERELKKIATDRGNLKPVYEVVEVIASVR